MKFWPSDSFEIETPLSPDEIVAALRAQVDPKRIFRLSRDHAPFQGEITRDGFRITRIIHYQNSFLPVVTGTFLPAESGIKIAVRLGIHPAVTAFMCVWFGFVGIGIVVVIAELLLGKAPALLHSLIPFGMLVFGWALASASFWSEARKQRPMLLNMFRGVAATGQRR